MKKTLLMLFAAAAFVGCDQGDQSGQEVSEPSGAERDVPMQSDTNTNTLSDPAGAGAGASQSDQQQSPSGASSGGAGGAANP